MLIIPNIALKKRMNDWAIFKGNEVNSIKIEKLNKLLETYDLKAIFNFIKA